MKSAGTSVLVCTVVVCFTRHVSSQGLVQSFLDFATWNNPTDSGGGSATTDSSGFPPDPAFPTDTGFPADTGFPPDPTFPTDTGFPADTGLPSESFLPDTGSPADKGFPKDTLPPDTGFPNDTGFLSDQFHIDPFPSDLQPIDTASNTLPSFDVNPKDTVSGTSGNFSPHFRFLPSMPKGTKFVNLNTGNTKTFQPTDNWIGGPTGAAVLDQVDLDPTGPAFMDTVGSTTNNVDNTNLGPVVPSNNVNIKRVDKPPVLPETVAGVGTQNDIIKDKGSPIVDETFPPNTIGTVDIKQDVWPDVPTMGSIGNFNTISLGPAFGTPVVLRQVNGGANTQSGLQAQIPDSWMQLYPKGREPPRNQLLSQMVKSEAPQLSPTYYLMAQASLNSFGKNRDMSIQLRQQRKRARNQRKQEKQKQRQQQKHNQK